MHKKKNLTSVCQVLLEMKKRKIPRNAATYFALLQLCDTEDQNQDIFPQLPEIILHQIESEKIEPTISLCDKLATGFLKKK